MFKHTFVSIPLFAFAICLLASCRKDDCSEPQPASNHIRFDQPAVGQVSRYIGLLGENYFLPDSNTFEYVDDTLHLEIVGKDDKGYKVKEILHYVGDTDPWMAGERDSVYYYYLKVTSDTVKFAPLVSTGYIQSRIITYAVGESGLNFKCIDNQKITIQGWKTSLDYCECNQMGYVEDYVLFGKEYDRLNVIVNNSFMTVDGPGETYVYSNKEGIVRFSHYSWWSQSGYGWDLLP